ALCGSGAPAVKSAELLSVSTVPPPARRSAVELDRPGAAAVSKSLAVPYPTKSCTAALDEQVAPQDSAGAWGARATLPLVALMPRPPEASGAGRATVPPAPAPSPTR